MDLQKIYANLYQHYGAQGWWPINSEYKKGSFKMPTRKEQFEIAAGAILTQNTSWKNVNKALDNLRKHNLLNKKAISSVPEKQLANLIKPSGYYNQKAKKLKHFAKSGRPATRENLLSTWGIGKETADSILLYAHQQPVFVIDAYTKRVFQRLGIRQAGYDSLQEFFHKNLPKEHRLYNEYHALIVQLAKDFCRTTPECADCPIKQHCRQKAI